MLHPLMPLLFLLAPQEAAPMEPAQSAAERLLSAVPEDAVFVISTAPWDEIRARAAENSWVGFFQDDAWSSIRAAMKSSFDTAREGGDGEGDGWDLDPFEVIESIHGPTLFALDSKGTGIEVIMLVDPGEDSAAFEEIFDGLWSRTEEEAHTFSTKDYDGVTFLLGEDDPEAEESEHVAMFEVDGVFGTVIGEEVDGLVERVHGMVDSLRGNDEAASFATSTAYLAAERTSTRMPAIRMAMNMKRVMELATEDADDESTEIAYDLGVFDISWAYIDADLGEGETLDFVMAIDNPKDTVIGDFMNLFGAAPMDMLDRLPDASDSIFVGRYDLWGAWNLVLETLAAYEPDTHDQLRSGLNGTRATMGLDVEGDLLSRFTGSFASFSMAVPKDEASPEFEELGMEVPEDVQLQSTAWIIGLSDPPVVETAVEKLMMLTGLGPEVEADEFQGTPYKKLDLGLQKILWAFTDTDFVYSTSPTPLRAALRQSATEPEKGHLERFRKTIADTGAGVSIVAINDTRTSVETALWAVELWNDMFGAFGGPEAMESLGNLEFPTRDLAGRYFEGTMMQTVVNTGDSLRVDFRAR